VTEYSPITAQATGVLMKVTSHVMNGFVASSRDFNYENLIKETQFDNMTRMACMAAMMKAHGWDVDNANNRFKEFIRAQRAAASLEAEGPHDAEIEDFIKSQSQPVLTQSMSDNINIVKAFCKFTHSNKPCRFWEDAWGPIPATIVYRSPKDKTIVSPKPPAKRGRPSAPGPSDTKGKAV
jgi:Cys-tRNA synthase (O-phospho-L-seryl-tRNA:Cys-tRNA synthase)